MPKMKKKITVTSPEALGAIISWMWNKSIWYGPLFGMWWNEEGSDLFREYASNRKQEYQKEPDVKMLKELYNTISRGKP